MPDYIRLVSYIYNYEEGIKRNNVGYARVETRNGQCKCTLHIAAPSLNDKQLKAYIFKRTEGGIKGILLGTLQVKNGMGDYKTVTDSLHVMSSPYGINDMGGIILYFTDKKFYATEWDDIPITRELVAFLEEKPEEKRISSEQVQKTEQDFGQSNRQQNENRYNPIEPCPESREEPEEREVPPESRQMPEEREVPPESSQMPEERKESEGILVPPYGENERNSVSPDNEENNKYSDYINNREDMDMRNNRENAEQNDTTGNSGKQVFEEHPLAKRIYKSFPRMYPFEDNDVAWCVKIEPQDIGLFPMEAWVLGNNSFLLHGYYSYRHLIFAKINDRNGINYIIGVPGVYHNREKFMAKMFGFENFKCVKRKDLRTGEFGYWYIPIVLR